MTGTECPKCGRDDFSNLSYMKRHHAMKHGESIAHESTFCEGCGDRFTYLPSEEHGRYCSMECTRIEREIGTCENCGEEFEFLQSNSEGRFCSHECLRGSGRVWNCEGRPKVDRVEVECHECSEAVLRRERYLEKVEVVFCSEVCRGEWVGRKSPSLKKINIDGVQLKSGWEAEVYKILTNSGIQFQYESESFEFNDGQTYTPDFILRNDIVIEVKGGITERCVNRSKKFMAEYPKYYYVVVGNRLPCDTYIDWSDRENLPEVVR